MCKRPPVLPPDLDNIHTDCLDALSIVFSSADRNLYCAQQRQLRNAFISNPIYVRVDAKKPRRAARMASSGDTSAMCTSRRVPLEACDTPTRHLQAAVNLDWVDEKTRTGTALPQDLLDAIDFCAKKSPAKLLHWRQRQVEIFNRISKTLLGLNVKILATRLKGHAAKSVAEHAHIALYALCCDATNSPDTTPALRMLSGFVLTSPDPIKDSGIHRKLSEPDVEAFRAQYAETSSGNWAHLHTQHADILAHGADKNAVKLCAVTALEVEKGVLSTGFNLSKLILFVMHCNPRDLPKDTDGNVDFPSRVSKRFGLDQLQNFRPIDDGTSNCFNNELILMLETIAPISAEYPARVASAIYQRFSHPPAGSQQRSMPEITVATDDVDMTYKRAPVNGYEIIAYFNPHVKCNATGEMGDVVYHVAFSLPFNYVSSVSSWCRVPALMAMVARRMFACLCDSYIDDWCIVDLAEAESSSQDTLHALHTAFKLPLVACRQPYCANCNKHPLPPSENLLKSAPIQPNVNAVTTLHL